MKQEHKKTLDLIYSLFPYSLIFVLLHFYFSAYIHKSYRRLSIWAIQDEIKKIVKNAGLEHKIRVLHHVFITLPLNSGGDIVAVQELLDHSSPDTTLRYARITEQRKREQHISAVIHT